MKQRIKIEYCTSWGYVGRAVALARKLLNEHKNDIQEVSLIPSTGGVFEVSFGNELIYSKKETGKFPENNEVEDIVKSKI